LIEFFRRNRVLLTSALCLLLAAGLILRTGSTPARADLLGRFFLELMAPLQRATSVFGRAISETRRNVSELLHARRENAALRARARRLDQQLDRLTEVELENGRLRRLLEFRQTVTADLITARIVGHDDGSLARTMVIDRGAQEGIVKGSAVLAPEGIVGQVFLASGHAARVLLVSDHNSGVDAIVQRTRARGIVQGTVDAGCVLKYVKRTEDVQVGDEVITSGLDGIFPKGLPIGRVVEVDKRGRGLFQHAEVQPRVDFDQLEEVLVTRGPVTPVEEPAAAPEE